MTTLLVFACMMGAGGPICVWTERQLDVPVSECKANSEELRGMILADLGRKGVPVVALAVECQGPAT